MDELQTDNQKNLGAISVIFQHFNEKFQSLLLTSPASTDIESIKLSEAYPTIVMTEKAGENDNDAEDEEKYFLFMDRIRVTEIDSFINIVFILLASYLVFNRLWPPAVSCFLEFLQMHEGYRRQNQKQI
ncbi:uncharacterized protein LOC116416534 [Nasonia vitripennis]|uniref:Uncharacterized protein n=1 Tax=Nasonia vitripennis TaxID=7425 RepID=A0A7M7Q7W5_NASVI|nr:uncharacterized protein LOC116416534 [Nasonia vitripennis]